MREMNIILPKSSKAPYLRIADAIRNRKKVDLQSDKVQTARDIGICLGD